MVLAHPRRTGATMIMVIRVGPHHAVEEDTATVEAKRVVVAEAVVGDHGVAVGEGILVASGMINVRLLPVVRESTVMRQRQSGRMRIRIVQGDMARPRRLSGDGRLCLRLVLEKTSLEEISQKGPTTTGMQGTSDRGLCKKPGMTKTSAREHRSRRIPPLGAIAAPLLNRLVQRWRLSIGSRSIPRTARLGQLWEKLGNGQTTAESQLSRN